MNVSLHPINVRIESLAAAMGEAHSRARRRPRSANGAALYASGRAEELPSTATTTTTTTATATATTTTTTTTATTTTTTPTSASSRMAAHSVVGTAGRSTLVVHLRTERGSQWVVQRSFREFYRLFRYMRRAFFRKKKRGRSLPGGCTCDVEERYAWVFSHPSLLAADGSSASANARSGVSFGATGKSRQPSRQSFEDVDADVFSKTLEDFVVFLTQHEVYSTTRELLIFLLPDKHHQAQGVAGTGSGSASGIKTSGTDSEVFRRARRLVSDSSEAEDVALQRRRRRKLRMLQQHRRRGSAVGLPSDDDDDDDDDDTFDQGHELGCHGDEPGDAHSSESDSDEEYNTLEGKLSELTTTMRDLLDSCRQLYGTRLAASCRAELVRLLGSQTMRSRSRCKVWLIASGANQMREEAEACSLAQPSDPPAASATASDGDRGDAPRRMLNIAPYETLLKKVGDTTPPKVQSRILRDVYRSGLSGGSHSSKILQPGKLLDTRNATHSAILFRVLCVYATRNTDVEYVQGMNLIAAHCIVNGMTEEETFWMLAAIVERVCGGNFYDRHLSGVRQAIARFTDHTLDTFAGFLCAHLRRLGISLFMYLWGPMVAMFCAEFSPRTTSVVWDLILLFGFDIGVHAFFLTIFSRMQLQLMQYDASGDLERYLMDEIRTWSSIVITYEAANLVSDNGAAPKSTETTSPLANQNPDTASTSPAHSVARRPSGLKKMLGALKGVVKAVGKGLAKAEEADLEQLRLRRLRIKRREYLLQQQREREQEAKERQQTPGPLQAFSGGEGRALYGASGSSSASDFTPSHREANAEGSQNRQRQGQQQQQQQARPRADTATLHGDPSIFIGDVLFWMLEILTREIPGAAASGSRQDPHEPHVQRPPSSPPFGAAAAGTDKSATSTTSTTTGTSDASVPELAQAQR